MRGLILKILKFNFILLWFDSHTELRSWKFPLWLANVWVITIETETRYLSRLFQSSCICRRNKSKNLDYPEFPP